MELKSLGFDLQLPPIPLVFVVGMLGSGLADELVALSRWTTTCLDVESRTQQQAACDLFSLLGCSFFAHPVSMGPEFSQSHNVMVFRSNNCVPQIRAHTGFHLPLPDGMPSVPRSKAGKEDQFSWMFFTIITQFLRHNHEAQWSTRACCLYSRQGSKLEAQLHIVELMVLVSFIIGFT